MGQCEVMVDNTTMTHLVVKCVRKGLYAEFEWSIVGRLVQPSHFLWHENLMKLFPFRVDKVD